MCCLTALADVPRAAVGPRATDLPKTGPIDKATSDKVIKCSLIRQGLDFLMEASCYPVIGTLPAAVGVLYSTIRLIDRVAIFPAIPASQFSPMS